MASDQEEPGWLKSLSRRLTQRIGQAWESPGADLYFPLYTWHNTFMYRKGYTKKYNEIPGGFGLGRSFRDEDGDRHALALIGFSDSNSRFQPYGGYFFIKSWAMDEAAHWRAGAGVVLGITARYEYSYIPMPLPLPAFSLSYRGVALEAIYVPDGYNSGNVLFAWLRLSF